MNIHQIRLIRKGLVFFVIFSVFVVSLGGCCLSCSQSSNYKAYTQRHGRVVRTGKVKAKPKANSSRTSTQKKTRQQSHTTTRPAAQ